MHCDTVATEMEFMFMSVLGAIISIAVGVVVFVKRTKQTETDGSA